MKQFRLSVVTSGETVFDGQVSCVNIPTGFGSVGVLANHAPMLCAVAKGVVRVTREEEPKLRIAVGAGIANIADNEAVLLVSGAEILEDE